MILLLIGHFLGSGEELLILLFVLTSIIEDVVKGESSWGRGPIFLFSNAFIKLHYIWRSSSTGCGRSLSNEHDRADVFDPPYTRNLVKLKVSV